MVCAQIDSTSTTFLRRHAVLSISNGPSDIIKDSSCMIHVEV